MLKNYEHDIKLRQQTFRTWLEAFCKEAPSLQEFAVASYKRYGLHVQPDNSIIYREWAPSAKRLSLFGEFNGWDREAHIMTPTGFGVWEITIPPKKGGEPAIPHRSQLKIFVHTASGAHQDRNPAWASYCVQDPGTFLFNACLWNPPAGEKFEFKHERPKAPVDLRIYECHVGMSSEEHVVASYTYFADNVLPRIAETGYNAVQLMAVKEHSYYGSFGYHVTNFFAPSSRCGTPDELKYLVDRAHAHGLIVLMDCIHSHASSNVIDGIAQLDGTDFQYFHAGEKGHHAQWDSKLFDYQKYEVLRFLLANIAWWMVEFRFDGFRFDAVTSILYHHHGINMGFSG